MVNAHVEESKNEKYSTQIYDSSFQQDFLIKAVLIIETFFCSMKISSSPAIFH